MVATSRAVRWAAGSFAVLLAAGSLLSLVLTFNVLGSPPVIPENADLPTRILASQPFDQSQWPVDLVSTLLVGAGFVALLLLAALLAGSDGALAARPIALAALGGAALFGVASQVVHLGAHDVANAVGYCDCGFKETEAISQLWGLMLLDGVSNWFLNVTGALSAIGVAAAGLWLGGTVMPAGWRTASWAVVGVLIVAIVASIVVPDPRITSVITTIAGGIAIPLWAAWLARSFGRQASTRIPAAVAA